MKKWKYYISASWIENGSIHGFITQLYKIGVYIIFDNDPAAQLNLNPNDLQKLCKKLSKEYAENKITNLSYGREITVIEKDGFYEELK